MSEAPPNDPAGTPATDLQIDRVVQDDVNVVIEVAGELDLYTSPGLKDALFDVIAGGQAHLVLDCANLRFVDSTGLGVLVAAHKRAAERGGELRIKSPSRILAKLLAITKLDTVFMP